MPLKASLILLLALICYRNCICKISVTNRGTAVFIFFKLPYYKVKEPTSRVVIIASLTHANKFKNKVSARQYAPGGRSYLTPKAWAFRVSQGPCMSLQSRIR